MTEEKSTILVADDNPANLQVVENMLSNFGFDVRVAMNGQDALLNINEEPPDLVLLDIHMPIMDGYETCMKLKENPATKDIPVIFASAMNEEFNKVKGFELGAVDYVTKPIGMDELKARVTIHIELAKRNRQLIEQATELTKFNEIMLEREMRIIDLKKEINKMAKKFNLEIPYPDSW
jgi:PleD family two-component response regulator